jgi:hypothetical protein
MRKQTRRIGDRQGMSVEAEYVQAVRDTTGYWGSSPPSRRIEPGTIGTVDQGIFVPDDDLRALPAFDVSVLQTKEEPSLNPVDVWRSSHVKWVTVRADGAAPVGGLPVGAKVEVSFDGTRQVVVACTGGRTLEFERLAAVKDQVRELAQAGGWEKPWAFVTDVYRVDSVRVLFSSAKDGAVTLEVRIAMPAEFGVGEYIFAAPGLAIGAGSEGLGVKTNEVDATCEPLFHALQFRRHLRIGHKDLRLMGTDDDFEEPSLGLIETDAGDAEPTE